jgi:hypothetical protein
MFNNVKDAQSGQHEWKAIETAPGRERILLFYPPQRGLPARIHICDEWDDTSITRWYFKPTHWRPLPESPPSADAVDPQVTDTGKPTTREKCSCCSSFAEEIAKVVEEMKHWTSEAVASIR